MNGWKKHQLVFLLIGFFSAAFAQINSSEQLNDLFEWGEYEQLIELLKPLHDSVPGTLDSTTVSQYWTFLGVSYFAIGDIESSRDAFLSAFEFDENIDLDKKYVTEEMYYLFEATRLESSSLKAVQSLQDSINSVLRENITEEPDLLMPEPVKKRNSILGISLTAAGVALGGFALYEYISAAQTNQGFRSAAAEGDKLEYDRLRNSLKRSNAIIAGCSIASGVFSGAGIFLHLTI